MKTYAHISAEICANAAKDLGLFLVKKGGNRTIAP